MRKKGGHKLRIYAIGDFGIKIELGQTHSPQLNQKIRSLCRLLDSGRLFGVIEWIPTYTGVTVYYEPLKISFQDLREQLKRLVKKSENDPATKGRVVTIPVVYGGRFGPDLTDVAAYHQKTEEEIITIHTNGTYLVYMIGFTPGFPYMGGLDEAIATPRKAMPRTLVKAGSVGIGGNQTGIYSMDAPGGWQIIGRTPLPLFLPKRKVPSFLQAGDTIRFQRISESEYIKIKTEGGGGICENRLK